jgi:gentisate 1,2-dioxygenase
MAQADLKTEVAALTQDSNRLNLVEFWTAIRKLETTDPPPMGEPFVWHYDDVLPQLLRAATIVPVEEADRRAVVFRNPGLGGRIATTPSLYAAYSLYNPGERASVHRHTINAGRIGLAGNGGYTTVNGVKCMIDRGDLVLTPSWSWHDHGNDGTDVNVWFDILDAPLAFGLNTHFFDFDYREERNGGARNQRIQTAQCVIDSSTNPFRAAGVTPANTATPRDASRSRMVFYPYKETRRALDLLKSDGFDSFDGVSVRLTDPLTGEFAMRTIDCTVKLLPPEGRTQPTRQSAHSIYLVIEGDGYTEVGSQRLDWSENDVFVVPNWMWHHHVNRGREREAVLYAMSDEPLVRLIESWRKQGMTEDGAIVQLA